MSVDKKQIIDLLQKIPSKLDQDFVIQQTTNLSNEVQIPIFQNNDSLIYNKSDYILYTLDKNISDHLISHWYNIPHQVISEPKIAWPDFVIDCKAIYQSNPWLPFGDFIKKLSNDISWYENKLISEISSQWIFINIYVSDDYILSAIKQILSYSSSFWNIDLWYRGEKWIIEYSSPNMAKSMSIWHFRNTIIWHIISNLSKTTWVDYILWNYLWDRGTPFGKFIFTLYHKYQDDPGIIDDIFADPTVQMGKIYADFKDLEVEDKDDKARKIFALLEKWDSDILSLWQIIRHLTLQDFSVTYDKLGIWFDTYLGESFATTLSWWIIEDMKEKDLIVESDGAYIVKFKKTDDNLKWKPLTSAQQADFDPDTDQVLVVSKSWDNTLYATRDLAICKFRSRVLGADKMVYVVWSEQRVYFEQIISLAIHLWYIKDDQMVHLWYGLYMQDGKKMSTRKGTVFRAMELIQEISEKIQTAFEGRIDDNVSEKLAISALIFNDIKWDIIHDVNFDLEAITRLNGDNGIYLQYTYTRIITLIDKISQMDWHISIYEDIKIDKLDKLEKNIISKLALLPSKISNSLYNYKPHLLAQYALELTWLVNKRYSESPKIIDLDIYDRQQKLIFLDVIKLVLEKVFDIFGFPKIERM